jgi:hypothetical protein
VIFTSAGEPDNREWNGELSEGQEFRVTVSPRYQANSSGLDYAEIIGSGTVVLDRKIFNFVNAGETNIKSFQNLDTLLSWALRAPRLEDVEVIASSVNFTFGQLPLDKNTSQAVSLAPDSSAVSEPAVVRKKKIKVELLDNSIDTILTFKIYNDEFNVPLNLAGFGMSFYNGSDGNDEFEQATFRNTFQMLEIENNSDLQLLAINPDTADIPLNVNFSAPQVINAGENAVMKVMCSYKVSSPSREFRSILKNVKVWDEVDSILLDVVDVNLVPIESSDLLVSNAVLHTTGSVEEDYFAYPNPFGRGEDQLAFISFRLESDSEVEIKIFTLLGELVKTYQFNATSGLHDRMIRWDGRNDRGVQVLNGVYLCFIDIKATGKRMVTKIAYIK